VTGVASGTAGVLAVAWGIEFLPDRALIVAGRPPVQSSRAVHAPAETLRSRISTDRAPAAAQNGTFSLRATWSRCR